MIFEGEFKDGKKYGKGYEYYYNKELSLDEEYLNWEKTEENKNNYFKGNLKFEGEYFKGKIISGKGYDIYANLILNIKMKNERNIIKTIICNLKENIKMGKDGME